MPPNTPAHGARIDFQAVERSHGNGISIRANGLCIEPGRVTVILGRSGCGKTTLLNLASGIEAPTAGEVLYDGQVLRGPAPHSAMIFQHNNLFPWMTARENIVFALENGGMKRDAAREQANTLLTRVGLADFGERLPAELSGGMRQRVALARSVAQQPRLLLLDEPFSALDVQTRRLMQRHLLETWRSTRATVLMVTHDLLEALMLAERIVLMASQPSRRIAEVISVDMPYPREPSNPEFQQLHQRLDAFLEQETLSAEHANPDISTPK